MCPLQGTLQALKYKSKMINSEVKTFFKELLTLQIIEHKSTHTCNPNTPESEVGE
jgi:hypothetical protein